MKRAYHKKQRRAAGGDGKMLPKALATGVSVSMIITLAVTALETSAAQKMMITMEFGPGVAVAIWIVASAVGSFLAAKMVHERRLPAALICGGIYTLILLLITGLVFGARYTGILKGLLSAIAGATTAGVLASGGKASRTKKYRFR